jgi:hypothetical protein
MSVELTRRWFLLGASAAIAATAIPFSTPVPAQTKFLRRSVFEINAGFIVDQPATADRRPASDDIAVVELFRNENCLFHVAIGPGANFVWIASPLAELILLPTEVFKLSLRSKSGFGFINLVCRDVFEDEEAITVVERHTFPSRGPAEVFALDTRDSARLDRYQIKTEIV